MKPIQYVLLFSFFFLLFSMHFTSSSDLSQDLGRHIKIGEIIVHERSIPDTNLFSYTNPDFPFINHHWLSEVLFYGIGAIFGLSSLIVVKVLIIILSVGVFITLGYRRQYPLVTLITALLFSPLLLERSTIRPEMFGYLFFSLILYIFFQYPKERKLLYLLPFIMLLWVNVHISFVLGFVVIGLLGLKIAGIIYKKSNDGKLHIPKEILPDIYCILATSIAASLNPNGIYGLLYPLTIFNNYGYTIVENQNIFFLNNLMVNPHIRYLFLLSPIIFGSIIVLLFKNMILEAVLLALFLTAQVMQIRHMPFFTLAAIPAVSLSIHLLLRKFRVHQRLTILTSAIVCVMCVGLSVFFIQNIYSNSFDLQKTFGMSMKEDGKSAADFMIENQLPRRIFNNFDIGGYAIYTLYPQYKVFVDNRPEAYPKDFLENVYMKLQTDPQLRKKIFDQYHIQTVFFAHTDQTFWAEAFMKDIFADKEWRLVYLDENMMIMTADTKHMDIRSSKNYLPDLLDNQTNYINAIKLSRIFGFLQKGELASLAFAKARELNPISCAVNKSIYYQYANSPQSQKADTIKNNYWYCF